MRNKKWLRTLLAVLAVGTVISAGAGSCTNKNNSSSSSEPPKGEEEVAFSLYQTETKLLLGDTLKIATSYDNLSDKVITFNSSNSTVATVSEDGTVTGLTNGTTTITATCGEETATCLVEVWLGGKVPMVHFAQFDDNQTTTRVGIGDILNFESTLTFNGKEYSDVEWTYNLEQTGDTVGTISNDGVFTATAEGQTTVTVTAAWRGITGSTLSKTMTIEVINDVQLYFNDGSVDALTLYTRSAFQGTPYLNKTPFVPYALENGNEKQVSVEIVSGEAIVQYDSVAQELTALKYGSATIRLSFVDAAQTMQTKDISVTVERPIGTASEAIENFSALDGDLNTTFATLLGENATITGAYQGETELTVDIANNKLFGVQTSSTEKTETTVRLYTDEIGVDVTLSGYTKIIRQASDMSVLKISTTNTKVEGYYVLANDISGATVANGMSSSTTNATYRESADVGFDGTFDGQGHTLDITVTATTYGVFGNLLANAEVKNVALNITLNGNATHVQAALAYGSRNAKLTNAYVKVTQNVTPTTYNTGLIKARALNMTNVIVDMTSVTYNAELYGSFLGMENANAGNTATQAYFLHGSVAPLWRDAKKVDKNPTVYYAKNDTLPAQEGFTESNYKNEIYRYTSLAEMVTNKERHDNYASFDTAYWELATGAPVWKAGL